MRSWKTETFAEERQVKYWYRSEFSKTLLQQVKGWSWRNQVNWQNHGIFGIFKFDFEQALSISNDQDYRRPANSCVVMDFWDELMAWKANINIQPVFNHYGAVAYI